MTLSRVTVTSNRPVLEMPRKAAGKTVSYMDEDSDDDFVLEAPSRKKKSKGNRTSTQDTGLDVAPVGMIC